MDQPSTAAMLVKGLMERDPEDKADLIMYQIESAWDLSQWQVVEESCPQTTSTDWQTNLGKSLLLAKNDDENGLHEHVAILRKDLMIPVAAAAMEQGSYRRSYDYLIKLQVLDEIETLSSLKDITEETIEKIFAEWKTRLTFSQYSLSTLEPVLKVRRALVEMAINRKQNEAVKVKLKTELSHCWLMSAKVARKAGQLNKPTICSWKHSNSVTRKFSLKVPSCPGPVIARPKLLLARYVDEAATLCPEIIPSIYNEAKTIRSNTEDPFYFSARFFDKIIGKNYEESELDGRGEIIFHVISQYVRSLMHGCCHLHQSLARLLTLWMDYGSRVEANSNGVNSKNSNKQSKEEMVKSLARMNDFIKKFLERAPPYYFLSVFPQLTSRICHAHADVWAILRTILIKTFLSYPHHVFWHMVALSKSSYPQRAKRCKEIFDHVKSKLKTNLIKDGLSLADKLVKLCDEKLPVGTVNCREVMPTLLKLVANKGFTNLLFPTTSNMTVMLPTIPMMNINNGLDHNPFPRDLVYLQSIEDTIVVMKSLVQPKRISFRGTDGRLYSFLCKPKDDLRRDCRLLDFNNLLNKLFMKDPESRKRNLHIRTYTVIPLNETNGIIEWVNNLQPFRIILTKTTKLDQDL